MFDDEKLNIRSFGLRAFTPLIPLWHFSKTRKSYFATIKKEKTRKKITSPSRNRIKPILL
jgi:hypothetical protein